MTVSGYVFVLQRSKDGILLPVPNPARNASLLRLQTVIMQDSGLRHESLKAATFLLAALPSRT